VSGRLVALGIVLLAALGATSALLVSGGRPSRPPLERAADFVRRTSSQAYLEGQTAFPAIQGPRTPSAWLELYFSPLGTAAWLTEDDEEARYVRGAPVLPRGVALIKGSVAPARGRQLVVQADDARWMIVVLGYEDPGRAPVLRQEWPFPRL
jgi:hypothetical protein